MNHSVFALGKSAVVRFVNPDSLLGEGPYITPTQILLPDSPSLEIIRDPEGGPQFLALSNEINLLGMRKWLAWGGVRDKAPFLYLFSGNMRNIVRNLGWKGFIDKLTPKRFDMARLLADSTSYREGVLLWTHCPHVPEMSIYQRIVVGPVIGLKDVVDAPVLDTGFRFSGEYYEAGIRGFAIGRGILRSDNSSQQFDLEDCNHFFMRVSHYMGTAPRKDFVGQ